MQIIPAIDLRDGRCVRLRQGDYSQETIFSDDPVEIACRWAEEGAERLHLVDLDGARAGQPVNHEVVRSIVKGVEIPCQLGGGIRDEAAIRQMLNEIGVDRVIIGTQALKQPVWFRQMVVAFPNTLVLGLDARDGMVATEGWMDLSQTPVIELARQYADLDLAAIIFTNIANDGMMQGIDDTTIDNLIELAGLSMGVIASGGVTTLDDIRKLSTVARAHPCLVGAIIGRALCEESIRLPEALQAVVVD